MEASTSLSGPALRLSLLQIYLPLDPEQALERARTAYAWVVGDGGAARERATPAPADAPVPTAVTLNEEAPAQLSRERRTGGRVWTPERIGRLHDLRARGVARADIAAELGISPDVVSWACRKYLRPETVEPAVTPEAANPDTTEPAQSPDPDPAAPPLTSSSRTPTDAEMIAAHIAAHGVKRGADFGPDQPAVDVLRAAGCEVLRRPGSPRQPWTVNGAGRTTADLWVMANRDLKRRGLPPITREG